MMWRDVVSLIAETAAHDEDGYETRTEIEREVYADVSSVKRMEFYEAYKANLRLDIVAKIREIDYNGEKLLEWNSKRYNVIRTYTDMREFIELSCAEVER